MSISIASGTATTFSEPSRSETLFPSYVRESGFEIVRLIKLYYDYLNSEGMPSYEINRMVANHDIDEMSDKYLTAIQLQIAKSVPESVSLDKRRLYKIIAQYYKTRGSEQSVVAFFRIFFDELISVFYPSALLFNTSADKSKTSARYVLQDGEYWQRYSYELRTQNDSSLWRDAFLKFVHPAGLKLFIAVLIIMYSNNTWEGPPENYINNINELSVEEYWNNINWDVLIGHHTPKFQPGSSYVLDYLFKVIIDSQTHYRTHTYRVAGVSDEQLYAAMMSVMIDVLSEIDVNIGQFRATYQTWLKFYDTVQISEYADRTAADAHAPYQPVNTCRFEALSTYAQLPIDEVTDSYGDIVDLDNEPSDWDMSSFTYEGDIGVDSLVYSSYAPELVNYYLATLP